MMDNERLDLSALDPICDPDRWGEVFATTITRVDAVLRERERKQDPLVMIAGWMRPLLAAAAIVIAVLIPVEIVLEKNETSAEQIRSLVTLSTAWAHGEQQPTGADLLRVLSDGRVQ